MDVEKPSLAMQRRRLSRRYNVSRHVTPIGDDSDGSDVEEKQASVVMPKKRLYPLFEELFKKKSSARGKALRTLVVEFERRVCYEFAEKNFVTLVHRCQACLKQGSAAEIDLALQLIGLTVLTVGAGDKAHEAYEELLVFLPELLKSKLSHSVKVIECLSIVTLVAARDFADTERSMEIIWQLMNQESKSNGTMRPSSLTAAAISAWALLLSDINRWEICQKNWKGLIRYLLKQLEEDDEDVHAASVEALAIIFENRRLEKFSDQAQKFSTIKDLKDDILKHVKRICNGAAKQDSSKILEDDYDKTTTLTICGRTLTFRTWSQLKQVNYIRRFLGYGFISHMMENEHLHSVFSFAPAKKESGLRLYKPEFEEVSIRIFVPDVKRAACSKRIHMSSNSLLNKGKTKLLNKYRSLAEESKVGHFFADEGLEY